MSDWIPWIVGAIGIIAAGGLSLPTLLKLLDYLKTAPVKPEPRIINAMEPEDAPSGDRADAFLHVDALINHFGEEGNIAGVNAAKAAGKALFESTELDVE